MLTGRHAALRDSRLVYRRRRGEGDTVLYLTAAEAG